MVRVFSSSEGNTAEMRADGRECAPSDGIAHMAHPQADDGQLARRAGK